MMAIAAAELIIIIIIIIIIAVLINNDASSIEIVCCIQKHYISPFSFLKILTVGPHLKMQTVESLH